MRATLAALALLTTAASSSAATLTTATLADGTPAIRLSGLIAAGDSEAFDRLLATKPTPTALVLEGLGGDAIVAMQMGEHARNLRAIVPAGHSCTSACALLWLAGKARVREPKADVGFHAVYVTKNGVKVVSAPGSALVGAYLMYLGFSAPAIVYMTSAGADEVQWLFPQDRTRYGITYEDGQPAASH